LSSATRTVVIGHKITRNGHVVKLGERPAPRSGSFDWAFPSDLPCGRFYKFYIEDTQPKWSYGWPFTVACESAP
jgi:hypothetical protein